MMRALSPPTWSEILREGLPVDGPHVARPSRLGYTWVVEDRRTGQVRATGTPGEAEARADAMNREVSAWT